MEFPVLDKLLELEDNDDGDGDGAETTTLADDDGAAAMTMPDDAADLSKKVDVDTKPTPDSSNRGSTEIKKGRLREG